VNFFKVIDKGCAPNREFRSHFPFSLVEFAGDCVFIGFGQISVHPREKDFVFFFDMIGEKFPVCLKVFDDGIRILLVEGLSHCSYMATSRFVVAEHGPDNCRLLVKILKKDSFFFCVVKLIGIGTDEVYPCRNDFPSFSGSHIQVLDDFRYQRQPLLYKQVLIYQPFYGGGIGLLP